MNFIDRMLNSSEINVDKKFNQKKKKKLGQQMTILNQKLHKLSSLIQIKLLVSVKLKD